MGRIHCRIRPAGARESPHAGPRLKRPPEALDAAWSGMMRYRLLLARQSPDWMTAAWGGRLFIT